MNEMTFHNVSFPSPTGSLFDKVVSIRWYDGTTSGMAMDSRARCAYRFDVLAWGPSQEQRVFALSHMEYQDFEELVNLISPHDNPRWPIWYIRWPSELSGGELLLSEMDRILARAKAPKYVLITDSLFETLLGGRLLEGAAQDLLPPHFDGEPFLDNFDYWKEYVGFVGGRVPHP